MAAPDPRMAELAGGIVQHHFDDRWFHQTRAFAELSLEFTVGLRDLLGADGGFRPSFLGHILVELLLDAELARRQPLALDRYYQAVRSLDAEFLTRAVGTLATGSVERLEDWVARFLSEQFLYDYADDERLLYRLNQVMRRVRLESLPADVAAFFPAARAAVRRRTAALLAPPEDAGGVLE